jgi:hypothetical protein
MKPAPAVTWLRSDHPVVPVNASTWSHLPEVENALRHGISAKTDANRPGFYEIEIGNKWYYIHIPKRIEGVYLVAVGQKSAESRRLVAQHAC